MYVHRRHSRNRQGVGNLAVGLAVVVGTGINFQGWDGQIARAFLVKKPHQQPHRLSRRETNFRTLHLLLRLAETETFQTRQLWREIRNLRCSIGKNGLAFGNSLGTSFGKQRHRRVAQYHGRLRNGRYFSDFQ